jgi:hypothetical protein
MKFNYLVLTLIFISLVFTNCEKESTIESIDSATTEVNYPEFPEDFDYKKNAEVTEDVLLSLNALTETDVTEDQVFNGIASNFIDNQDEADQFIKEIRSEHLLLETMDPLAFVDRNFSKAVELNEISAFQKEMLVSYYAELFESIEIEEISDWQQMLEFWESKDLQVISDTNINKKEKEFIRFHVSLQIGYSSFWKKMQDIEFQNSNVATNRACTTDFQNTLCNLARDAARATARSLFNCNQGNIIVRLGCFLAREAAALIAGAAARAACCAAFPPGGNTGGGGSSGCGADQTRLNTGEANCSTAMGTWSSSSYCPNGTIIFSVSTSCFGTRYCCR